MVYVKLNYIQYRNQASSVSIGPRLWAEAPWFNFATDKVRLGTLQNSPAWIISLSTSDKRTSSYISTSSMSCNDVSTKCHNQWVIQQQHCVAQFSNKHFTHTTRYINMMYTMQLSLDSHPNGRDKEKPNVINSRIINEKRTENHGNYHPYNLADLR